MTDMAIKWNNLRTDTFVAASAKKLPYILLIIITAFILVSCVPINNSTVLLPTVDDFSNPNEVTHRKNLRLGITPGPYGSMFSETIFPRLEALGYTLEIYEFSNFSEPNIALAEGIIDLNMFQHYDFLIDFNFDNNLDLSAITELPTLPMALFSKKYNSLADIEYGATVVLPNDNTNLSRSLRILEFAGLIRLAADISRTRATVDDIIENPRGLDFMLRYAEDIPQILSYVSLGIVNGNFIISNGLDVSSALYVEVLSENYLNVIAIRTEDLNQQFARDIIDVVYSPEFRDAILNKNGNYFFFQMPRNFSRILG